MKLVLVFLLSVVSACLARDCASLKPEDFERKEYIMRYYPYAGKTVQCFVSRLLVQGDEVWYRFVAVIRGTPFMEDESSFIPLKDCSYEILKEKFEHFSQLATGQLTQPQTK